MIEASDVPAFLDTAAKATQALLIEPLVAAVVREGGMWLALAAMVAMVMMSSRISSRRCWRPVAR